MLHSVLDPEVAKDPANLIVYGGTGKAARSWECFHAIVEALENLDVDETLLIQSGKPVGVFTTHEWAPRVLIANSLLVPKWATWDHFLELEQKGLIMFGQMTAGSWAYVGTQGILQGTYETLAAVAEKHFGGTLRGRLVLTAGLGEMGGAQPLAVTMNDGVALVVDVDKWAIERRIRHRYLDTWTDDLSEALDLVREAMEEGDSRSVGLLGNAAFATRFLLQWVASERAGESVVPIAFWYLSIVGSLILLVYAIHLRNPVFTLAYLPNALIYARNIALQRK